MWGLRKENIPIERLIDSGEVLCWSAKWLDEGKTMFMSKLNGKEEMLTAIHDLLDEADAVIHYYGSNFDIPTLNKEFIKMGWKPPSPYKQIDLCKIVRQRFKFPSNKLDYVAQALGIGKKVKHRGFQLWIDCMNDNPDAWMEMMAYNIEDVELLDRLYPILLPWIKNHPNIGLHDDKSEVCPNCGSEHLERRGFSFTHAGKYQRYRCLDCGTWSRSKNTEAVKGILQQDKN